MTGSAGVPQVVIVAGGLGTRLARHTGNGPKALVQAAGRPFLGYVLTWLGGQGARRIHLCLGHRADQVRGFLAAHGGDWPMLTFTTSVEPAPLGTAGCLRAAGSAVEDEFVLLLGDTYTPIDLGAAVDRWRRTGREAGMCVLHNRDWLVPSNVEVEDGRVVRYDKSAPPGTLEYVDYGIAFLRRASLDRLPGDGPADLSRLFHSLIAEDALAAIDVEHRFYEIGSEEGYAEFCGLAAEGLPVPAEVRLG